MAAITTDTHHQLPPFVARRRSAQVLPHRPPVRAAQGGQPLAPADVAVRLVLAIAAVVVVLAVAVGTAAIGRVLDGQRGIPADPAAATSLG
ncbi:MAG: hypothetical protein JJE52_06675 [Acidimicrobiia bacterium]|nr:hypothetical protein [Acidimicrobiia bacterium]